MQHYCIPAEAHGPFLASVSYFRKTQDSKLTCPEFLAYWMWIVTAASGSRKTKARLRASFQCGDGNVSQKSTGSITKMISDSYVCKQGQWRLSEAVRPEKHSFMVLMPIINNSSSKLKHIHVMSDHHTERIKDNLLGLIL